MLRSIRTHATSIASEAVHPVAWLPVGLLVGGAGLFLCLLVAAGAPYCRLPGLVLGGGLRATFRNAAMVVQQHEEAELDVLDAV